MKKTTRLHPKSKKAVKSQTNAVAAALKKTGSSDNVISLSLTQLSTIYVLFIIINALVVYLAHTFFPMSVVLGTHLLSPMIALLQSMLVFTLIIVGSMPVLEILTKQLQVKMSDKTWILAYYVINVVGLWITARFAELIGLGLSSWMISAVLGLVLSLLQGVAYKMFKAIE